jgi:hypothetical protein
MGHPNQFRERASRLLKIAIMAHEDGQLAYAQELTRLAAEALNEATKLEREHSPHQSAGGVFGGK